MLLCAGPPSNLREHAVESFAYQVLNLIHIVLTVVAVGFNLSYGVWFSRGARRPEEVFALRGVKFLDDRFANPSYVLLGVTGVALAIIGDIPLSEFWLAASGVLWLVAIVVAYAVYTPLLRRQIAVLEAGAVPAGAVPAGAVPASAESGAAQSGTAGSGTAGSGAFDEAAYAATARRVAVVGQLLGLLVVLILVLMVFKPGS